MTASEGPLWTVALGGATGTFLQYALLVTAAPRIGVYRILLALTAIASGSLGAVVAANLPNHAYTIIGVGFLGTLAPLSTFAYATLGWASVDRISLSILRLTGLVFTGSAMAILGYAAVDASTIIFEKIPMPMQ